MKISLIKSKYRMAAIGALIFFIGIAIYQYNLAEQQYAMYQDAKSYYAQKDYDQAKKIINLYNSTFFHGKYQSELNDLEKQIGEDIQVERAHDIFLQSKDYLSKQQFEEAERSLNGYIKVYPGGADVVEANELLQKYALQFTQEREVREKEQQARVKAEEARKAEEKAANIAKWDEMLESYNTVQSSNNYKILYGGVRIDGNRVVILVTDYWNSVSKDIKTAYVNQCTSLWYGMCGARKLPVGMSFKFEHNASGRTVATWDSNWGASIK